MNRRAFLARTLAIGIGAASGAIVSGHWVGARRSDTDQTLLSTQLTVLRRCAGFMVGAGKKDGGIIAFDPGCPHCAALWLGLKPLWAEYHFKWVPVALLSERSFRQTVAIVSADDPVATMDQHELSLAAGGSGIHEEIDTGEIASALTENIRAFDALDLRAVPRWLVRGQDGRVVLYQWTFEARQLKRFLAANAAG